MALLLDANCSHAYSKTIIAIITTAEGAYLSNCNYSVAYYNLLTKKDETLSCMRIAFMIESSQAEYFQHGGR